MVALWETHSFNECPLQEVQVGDPQITESRGSIGKISNLKSAIYTTHGLNTSLTPLLLISLQ